MSLALLHKDSLTLSSDETKTFCKSVKQLFKIKKCPCGSNNPEYFLGRQKTLFCKKCTVEMYE